LLGIHFVLGKGAIAEALRVEGAEMDFRTRGRAWEDYFYSRGPAGENDAGLAEMEREVREDVGLRQ